MNDDLLERLQADVYGVLMATPSLAPARIILDNKGDLEGELENQLATLNGRSGKAGLAVIVLACEVEGTESNLPGPPLDVRVDVQCIELVEMNRSACDGTGIRSSTAAVRTLAALQHTSLGSHVLHAVKRPIIPLKMRQGDVAHLVSVQARLDGLATNKTGVVSAEWDDEAEAAVLTCATPGAEIYFTTDGGFPAAWNEDAIRYIAPIPMVAAGLRIRAAAYAPDMNPGDILHFTIQS